MGILILLRQYLYIETVPGMHGEKESFVRDDFHSSHGGLRSSPTIGIKTAEILFICEDVTSDTSLYKSI